MAEKSLASEVAAEAASAATPGRDGEHVTQRRDGDTLEARSSGTRIRTVEDLLRHIEADMSRFEIAASEATKWECGDGDGGSIELHRVFVRLKPKAGPTVREVVEAMISAAAIPAEKASPRKAVPKPKKFAPWQVLVVADPHFGKYAWHKTTGGDDYDLDIAARLVRETSTQLLAIGDAYKPGRRTIAFIGDIFHYDRPDGSTTSGTPLERDGRLQKMIHVGCDTLLAMVKASADTVPTDVVIVNGNHDEVMTWTFQRILQERFRGSKSVSVKQEFTGRQYVSHGKNLLGFAHGHRAKKKLPQIMALEASRQWSECRYREWHTGHYHSQAAEWQRPIETLDGVIVRTAPALCPPDDWHSVNGFIGSRQAMETFLYDPAGGLSSMHIAGLDECCTN